MSTPNWQIVAPFPNDTRCFYLHVPIEANKENFIVVSFEGYTVNAATVRKYDINTNQWSLIMNSMESQFCDIESLECTALDINKNELWLICSYTENPENEPYEPYEPAVAQIDLNEIKIKHHTINCDFDKIMMIETKLHAMGNSDNKTFEKVTTMDVRASGLIYVKNPKHILAFGGFRDLTNAVNGWTNTTYLNSILKYDFKTNQWNTMNVLLPTPICSVCCTLAINNKYVLLFGGYSQQHYDTIYIYSIKNNTIKTSKIRCPTKSLFAAVTVNDSIRDEYVVFGFIRDTWKSKEFMDYCFPPYYLQKLINA
eukprot:337397_1